MNSKCTHVVRNFVQLLGNVLHTCGFLFPEVADLILAVLNGNPVHMCHKDTVLLLPDHVMVECGGSVYCSLVRKPCLDQLSCHLV